MSMLQKIAIANIKKMRMRHSMNQDELGEILDLTPNTISRIEKRHVEPKLIRSLLAVLNK